MSNLCTYPVAARMEASQVAALDAVADAHGMTRSEFVRAAVVKAMMHPDDVIAIAGLARQRVAALATLAEAITHLKKLGALYAYSLKARRPPDKEEVVERLRVMRTLQRAARDLIAE